jgi:flagellar biosynthesis protein FlhG
VVATDEPTSLTDAYAVLKLHQRDVAPRPSAARIVINQAASQASGERTYATLARACQSFLGQTPRLAGIVRRDEKVRDAIRRQTLLMTRHPAADAARDVTDLVRAL